MARPTITLGVTIFWLRTPKHQTFAETCRKRFRRDECEWVDLRHQRKVQIGCLADMQALLFEHWNEIRIVDRDKRERVIQRDGSEVKQETLFAER
jgi:hypothetical protein